MIFRFSANPANFATQFATVNTAANDWTDIKFPPGADGSLDSYSDLFIQNAIDNQASIYSDLGTLTSVRPACDPRLPDAAEICYDSAFSSEGVFTGLFCGDGTFTLDEVKENAKRPIAANKLEQSTKPATSKKPSLSVSPSSLKTLSVTRILSGRHVSLVRSRLQNIRLLSVSQNAQTHQSGQAGIVGAKRAPPRVRQMT